MRLMSLTVRNESAKIKFHSAQYDAVSFVSIDLQLTHFFRKVFRWDETKETIFFFVSSILCDFSSQTIQNTNIDLFDACVWRIKKAIRTFFDEQ